MQDPATKRARRFGTYIFLELDTTASGTPSCKDQNCKDQHWNYHNKLAKSGNPEDLKRHFDCYKNYVPDSWKPTIGNIAFLAVEAEEVGKLLPLDKKTLRQTVDDFINYKKKEINMEISEDDLRSANGDYPNPFQFYNWIISRITAEARNLEDEWGKLKTWINKCQKPVCIIAHNGFFHDFCVLYIELKRIGASIQEEIYFVDSMLGMRNLQCGKLSLPEVYKELFDKEPRWESALDRCYTLIKVVSGSGERMFEYIDAYATRLDFSRSLNATGIPEENWGLEMLRVWNRTFNKHERTFIAVNNGVQPGLLGDIIGQLERDGLKLIEIKKFTQEQLENHRNVHNSPFYIYLQQQETPENVFGMVWQGINAVDKGLSRIEELDGHGVCHGSATRSSANREIAMLFHDTV